AVQHRLQPGMADAGRPGLRGGRRQSPRIDRLRPRLQPGHLGRLGNKDFQDVMAAVDQAIAMGVADPDRLGLGGWSYGGILTDHVLVRTTRFKAATSGASEVNYLANYGTDQYQYEWETELGLPWKNTELWMHLSPW